MNVVPLLHSFSMSTCGRVSIGRLRHASIASRGERLCSGGHTKTVQAARQFDKKGTGDGSDNRSGLKLTVCGSHSFSIGQKEPVSSLCGSHLDDVGVRQSRPPYPVWGTHSDCVEMTQSVSFVCGVHPLSWGLTRDRTVKWDIRSEDGTGNHVGRDYTGINIRKVSVLDFSLSVGHQHSEFSHHLVWPDTRQHKRKSLFGGIDRQVLDKLFSIWPSRSVLKTMQQSFHNDTHRLDKIEATLTLESDDDLARLTQQVMKSAGEKDVMVRSVPEKQVQNFILDLHRCGLPVSDIVSLLSSEAIFLVKHRATLSRVHMLLSLGFDTGSVKTLLQHCPASIHVSQSQVTQVIDALRDLSFREDSMVKVVTGNPAVLTVTPSQLCQRVSSLRQLFKSADVVTLALNSPQILTDPWEDIQSKFDYVFHEMNVTQKQMVHASVFAYPLSHIKTRHAFLVRAGLFLMGKRREGERSPNARLDQIIDTSDKQFCRKFGGFEMEEYRAFSELFSKEEALLEAMESQTLDD